MSTDDSFEPRDARAGDPAGVAVGTPDATPRFTGAATPPVHAVASGDRAIGPADAPVTLVVYGNYSCLHCRRAYAVLADIARDAGDRLRVVYRHFARPEDFPDAERAAEAASAAAAQGRFWDMHLRLATGAPFFDERALVAQAADLGLDVARFGAELRAGVYRERVRSEHAGGESAGVTATPTFYLDGAYFADRWDLDALRAAVVARVERRA